jgi:hypothetical protein
VPPKLDESAAKRLGRSSPWAGTIGSKTKQDFAAGKQLRSEPSVPIYKKKASRSALPGFAVPYSRDFAPIRL